MITVYSGLILSFVCIVSVAAVGQKWTKIDGSESTFFIDSTKRTFGDAEANCVKQGGHLATIVNLTYQETIHNAAEAAKVSSYWIGLTDYYKDNTFQWTSGYLSLAWLFWSAPLASQSQPMVDCVSVNTTLNVTKSWFVDNCYVKRPSVCLKGGLPKEIRPIDMVKKKGTCPTGFFRVSNRCLKIFADEADKQTWKTANEKCQKLEKAKNGGLATILHEDEQNLLTALMLNKSVDLWIGLQEEPSVAYYSFKWARNYAVAFTNWKTSEPNGKMTDKPEGGNETTAEVNKTESCVMMYRRNKNPGEWNDQECSAKLGYICESDLLAEDANTKPLPNPLFPADSNCTKGEQEYNEFCYWKGGSAKSFEAAEKECQKKTNGHLVTPHNLYEVAYLRAFMAAHGVSRTVLGQQWTRSKKGGFSVSSVDGVTSGVDDLRGLDFSAIEALTCVVTSQAEGQHVEMENCSLPGGPVDAVCRYPLVNTPLHPDNFNFTCDKGWTPGKRSRRCLQSSDHTLTRAEAISHCKSRGAQLLSIRSVQDQVDVSELANKFTKGVWIGLDVAWVGKKYTLRWIDGSPVTFIHWRTNEPSLPVDGKTESCAVLRAGSHDWNNVHCERQKNFICYIPAEEASVPTSTSSTFTSTSSTSSTSTAAPATSTAVTTTVPATTTQPTTPVTPATTTVTPSTASPTTAKPTPEPCPHGMFRHFNQCYKLVKEKQTWLEARKSCQDMGKHVELVSILDSDENDFVSRLVKKALGNDSDGAWLGLTDKFGKFENQFAYWSDGSSMTVAFFDPKHSPNIVGDSDCVVMRSTKLWYPTHCTYLKPFVCKWSKAEKKPVTPPLPPPGNKYCDEGYVRFNKMCYSLHQKPLVYDAAEEMCKHSVGKELRKFAGLARVDTFEVNEFLMSLLLPLKDTVAWFGLHYKDNKFHWSDNEPVRYTRWPVNMSYVGDSTKCVGIGTSHVSVFTGYWYARKCSDKLPYICQAPLMRKNELRRKNNCPAGYSAYEVGNTCYRLINKTYTYDRAMAICEADNKKFGKNGNAVSMLTFTSVPEMSFVRAWLVINAVSRDRRVWLGLKLKKGKHVWKWNNGELVNFTYTSGFPSDPSGCFYMMQIQENKKEHGQQYGMQTDPTCKLPAVAVCKFAARAPLVKPRECLLTREGHGYVGHRAESKSGRSCVRWDLVSDLSILHRLQGAMPDGSMSGASNFCRHPRGSTASVPSCYTSVGDKKHIPRLEECDIPLCPQQSHGYVVVVAILVIVLLVTISFFVGVMLWRRTNTARGFIPYLRQHDPEGGTSFHNPIYTPAATC